jgi:hypothetical protein
MRLGHAGNLKPTSKQGLIVAKTSQSASASPADDDLDSEGVPTKGHATPTRKEREAARKRPLVAGNSPEARKAARTTSQAQRERARVGMQNGEERYLPVRDRGPQKRYVRDYIDARWSVGELAIPLLVVLLVASVFGPQVQEVVTFGLYAYLAIVVIDVLLLGRRLKNALGEKHGDTRVEKIQWYAAMRTIQFRLLRLPKPQVKRGQFPK